MFEGILRFLCSPRKSPIAFERARYEYCLGIYERESARKETLERKAQVYLALIAVFVGAVFLKADVLTALANLLSSSGDIPVQGCLLLVATALFSVSLIVSLTSLLLAIHVRGYAPDAPVATVSALFAPESGFLPAQDEVTLYHEAAMALALAVEADRKLNDVKAFWISVSSFALLGTIIAMVLFVGTLAYISLS
jgi:hypothetical protein